MGKDKNSKPLQFGGFFFFFIGDFIRKKQEQQAIGDRVKCLTEPVQTVSLTSVKTSKTNRDKAK